MHLILSACILFPAVVDILHYLLSFLFPSPIFSETSGRMYSVLLLSAIVIAILLYILTFLYSVLQILKRKKSHQNRFEKWYDRYKSAIQISNAITMSSFLSLFVSSLYIPFFQQLSIDPIFLKGSLFVILMLLNLLPQSKWSSLIHALTSGLTVGIIVYFVYAIAQEFQPHEYYSFPLDDAKGRYVLNYDGDYWLTYYTVEKDCNQKMNICLEKLIKTGNTSITESPVDLTPYLDKPVTIKGSFVKIHGALIGNMKTFCLITNGKKDCKESKGPGIWYASPLKITSIKIHL